MSGLNEDVAVSCPWFSEPLKLRQPNFRSSECVAILTSALFVLPRCPLSAGEQWPLALQSMVEVSNR